MGGGRLNANTGRALLAGLRQKSSHTRDLCRTEARGAARWALRLTFRSMVSTPHGRVFTVVAITR